MSEENGIHKFPGDGFEHLYQFDCPCDPFLESTSMGTTVFIHREFVVPDRLPDDFTT